jgi:hypothetical protein
MKSGMGKCRGVALLATIVVVALGRPSLAGADAKSEIQTKIKEAMESYDLMDYDAAKKLLNQAVAVAKKNKLDKDTVLARAYLDLGIVEFAVPDQAAAKGSFISAVQIDPKIQIDAAYRSAEMSKLLDEARGEAKGGGGSITTSGGGGGAGDVGPAPDCTGVKGIQHEIVDTAKGGAPLKLEAMIGSDVKAVKVSLWYRAKGATEFTEVKMTNNACKYVGSIPATALHGDMLHYYVAAYDKGGKLLVGKGSQGAPNLVDIQGGGAAAKGKTASDDEDPLTKGGAKPKQTAKAEPHDDSMGEVDKGTPKPSGPKQTKVTLTLFAGTGIGYVAGTTEGGNTVKSPGIAPSLLVITPELAYQINPKLSIGLAARLGFPIGANITDPMTMSKTSATLGPAILARVRYSLAPDGNGIRILGQAGVGILRDTLKLDNSTAAMGDTDVVAQGPLLIGGGIGYRKPLGNSLAFLAEASLLLGIKAGCSTDASGNCTLGQPVNSPALNTGVTTDLSLGLTYGF